VDKATLVHSLHNDKIRDAHSIDEASLEMNVRGTQGHLTVRDQYEIPS
jgi:hypothetical protein